MKKERKVIYWFRNDLRLHDQATLAGLAASSDEVIPFYCYDQRFFRQTSLAFPRTGSYRAKFLTETVSNLKTNLQALGSGLLIRKGNTSEELAQLVRQVDADAIYAHLEFADEEIAIEQAVAEKTGIPLHLHESNGLFTPQDLPFAVRDLPDIYTHFRKQVQRQLKTMHAGKTVTALPSLPAELESDSNVSLPDLGLTPPLLDSRSVMHFTGGENAALDRLWEYLWDTQQVATYKKTRNGLIGKDYSTKFSPWLANGALSPLKIVEEVNRFEQEITRNDSTYWVKFELMWREYFRWVARKYGSRIFFRYGIKNERMHLRKDFAAFERWRIGRTGNSFVDANMRELLQTGYMSNRGRQNAASFLVKDLNIDWRWGAYWFESQLIDYDVYSNWGNWMYIAGVGNDPRENRYFNVNKQAQRYDPHEAYRDLWLSE